MGFHGPDGDGELARDVAAELSPYHMGEDLQLPGRQRVEAIVGERPYFLGVGGSGERVIDGTYQQTCIDWLL